MLKILVVEDNPELAQAYRLALSQRGHDVQIEGTGAGGARAAIADEPDVVLLDLMLPDIDGFSVCRHIRQDSDVPIIMLTARDDDGDVIGGLDSGADDYVVKPVSPGVLEARIRAVVRSRQPAAQESAPATVLEYEGLRVDLGSLEVTRDGVELELSPNELRLLMVLLEHQGQVLSREQLLDRAWGTAAAGDLRLVNAAVQRLRQKIEADPAEPQLLRTVRGFGYRLG
ncbi:DNA-binding response OmpR family regulator [Leucobacter komagatae]|uniref:DNA-binding response OmpR family regulator n=1 Tax=Leucobacter komagatae TaxID=55969 RepID=A0A542XYF3_9MICO|nr:response regulator transcription factor [Leucobacter komagatae]TQL40866.1 DNA-binding response OmpR family regulator [Leucobacter komagatae]